MTSLFLTMAYTIRTLGPFRVERDGLPVEGFTYNKVRALLIYLACAPERPHSRAALCVLLWPDQPEAPARQSLSQALTRLRKAMGPDIVTTNTQTVQLSAPVQVDALDLLECLELSERHSHYAWKTCAACARRLTRGLAFYDDDFLADFYIADSAGFEEWALAWRERLRQRMLSACDRLIERHTWRGSLAQAVEVARRRVSLDPLVENGHRDLIRLLVRNGELTAAEAQGESLRRLLKAELDLAPEPETESLLADIRAGRDVVGRVVLAPAYTGPRPAHRLIGRTDELADICQRLQDDAVRAVTLTGAPGIGKTRLALEVAQALAGDFADGLVVMELAALPEASLVGPALLQALGLTDQSGSAVRESLVEHLRGRQMLVVFDNFEHVLDAATLVSDTLSACPFVKVLATSRAALNIRFEHHVALAPLNSEAAAQLFVERAQAASAAFVAPGAADASVLADIVKRVDHVPLAIELIAARVRALSLADLRAQLDRRLPLLTGGARDLPARQRTLRDAIAWSVDRLTTEEQGLFAVLGVFVGGFTAEAASAVAQVDAQLLLMGLIDNSLVQADDAAGTKRYACFETVREYALERLKASGALGHAQARHAAYFADLAGSASPHFLGPQIGRWMNRIEIELPNIRAVVEWCRVHDLGLGLRLISAVNRLWYARGHMHEASGWLSALLDDPRASQVDRSDLAAGMVAAGVLYQHMNDNARAQERMETGLAIYQSLGDRHRIAGALSNLGNILLNQGDAAGAERCYRDSLALRRALDDRWGIASSTNNLGVAVRRLGRPEEAAELYQDCIARYRALEDYSSAASSMTNLASVRLQLGQADAARALSEEALELLKDDGDLFRIADAYFILASAHMHQGRLDLARDGYGVCARIAAQAQDNLLPLYALVRLGEIEWIAERWPAERLIELLAMTAQRLTAGNVALDPDHQLPYDRLESATRSAVAPEVFDAAWARGLNRTIDEALLWIPDEPPAPDDRRGVAH